MSDETRTASLSVPDVGRPPSEIVHLPLSTIMPDPENIRERNQDEEIDALAVNIAKVGLLQAIVVHPLDGKFRISAGHRRYQAATQLGWETIAATIVPTPATLFDRLDLMAAENLQRRQLNLIERAKLFQRYIDGGMRQKDVAARLGLTQSSVSQMLPLLALPDDIQVKIATREIPFAQAMKLAVKNRNENAEKPHGTFGKTRADVTGATVPYFNSEHPLHAAARDLCVAHAHPTYKLIGGSCGECWESAIRLDALSVAPTSLPSAAPEVRHFDSPRDLMRLLRCARCGVGGLERADEKLCHLTTVGADGGKRRKAIKEHDFQVPVTVHDEAMSA